MTLEDQHTDLKSLRIFTGRTADWDALAKDCVCFANGARHFSCFPTRRDPTE